MGDSASLELRLVGKISGRFFVAGYQRGYRWGEQEVTRLLEDIWSNGERPYCLQPVVVKRRPGVESEWELVDGQQRLTTLYLIFAYMKRAGLKNIIPPYSITYETRPGSEKYLQEIAAERSGENIDFFHIHAAYEVIQRWFDGHAEERQVVADEFYRYLFRFVRIIWYEAPPEAMATTLFTRLNVGRIPLTDAELVKALLLSRSRGQGGQADRAHELAAQWDGIERDLRSPEVWAFVTDAEADECPTRISLLLDTLADELACGSAEDLGHLQGAGRSGPRRPLFLTFDRLRREIEASSPEAVWNKVVDLHALVQGWFENRDLYHKIGYLVAVGERFGDLVKLATGRTKSCFDALLDERIRDQLDLDRTEVAELSYETDGGREKCARLLLLMNVETIRRREHSSERYSFFSHRAEAWSLEHIHAQHAEGLNKAEQWKEWLRLHREALAELPGVEEGCRSALLARIDAARGETTRPLFQELARDVIGFFNQAAGARPAAESSVHSITNLALLPGRANSALGNSVFEVKRRRILELDRNGAYIPVCTRHVFLKYYTEADAQQIHFWGPQDRESYFSAMVSVERGVIHKYLRSGTQQP